MAERMANSIGRELRYFEYKFRKKQSKKSNKKDKDKNANPRGPMAWSDSYQTEDVKFDPTSSEEIKKAVPSNKGEEELQVQVALAMSREEESVRQKQAESDDIRLKLALKESEQDASPSKPIAPQPSLLDDPFGGQSQLASNDPWGSGAASAPTFDPFGAPTQATVPSNFSAPSNNQFDPFTGLPSQPQSTVLAPSFAPPTNTYDPFTGMSVPQAQTAHPQVNNDLGNDPWGSPPAPVVAPTTSMDPWASNTPVSSNSAQFSAPASFATPASVPAQDAWGLSAPPQNFPTPTPNGGAWGYPASFPTTNTQPAKFDPFSESLASQSSAPLAPTLDSFSPTSDFNTPPAFDPLKDFDSIHIGSAAPPSPVVLRQNPTSSSVAKDLFPIQPILEPTNGTQENAQSLDNDKKLKETERFLGENSNLVNLDSWKKYQLPYVSKPLGTQSHNPFATTGPSKTLNEMKQQPVFQ